MGAILSRFRQDQNDYEKILSDLDSNIRKAELRLSAIKIREKRLMGLWMVYSALAWAGYVGVYALYLHDQYRQSDDWIWLTIPMLAGIPVIYIVRSLITVWYKRAKTNEESQLNLLRADQKLKVEELKKKTAYYTTKTLLERYDPSSQQQQQQQQRGQVRLGPDGKPLPLPQNGQQRPGNPMEAGGLRQRTGPGVGGPNGGPMMVMGPDGQLRPAGPRGPQGPGQGPQHQHPGGQQQQQGQHLQQQQQGQHLQHPMQQQQQGRPQNGPSPYGSPNTERHWYDKIVDVIVGDEGPETKYALICAQCFAHNGLALPQEIDDIQYICPNCNFFNSSRRKARMALSPPAPGTGNLSPASAAIADQTLRLARDRPLPISRDASPAPGGRRFSNSSNISRQSHGQGRNSFGDEQGEQLPGYADHVDGQSYSKAGKRAGVSRLGQEMNDNDNDNDNTHQEVDEASFENNWNDDDAHPILHQPTTESEHEEEEEQEEEGYDVQDAGVEVDGAENNDEDEDKDEDSQPRVSTRSKSKGATTTNSDAGKKKSKK